MILKWSCTDIYDYKAAQPPISLKDNIIVYSSQINIDFFDVGKFLLMSKLEPEFLKCELVRVADNELELLPSFLLIDLSPLCLGLTFEMFTSLYFLPCLI